LSIDQATRSNGGLLRGYVVGSSPDRAFDVSVQNAPLSTVAGPALTSRGYLVFRVTRIEPGEPLPRAQATARARALLLDAERTRVLSGFMTQIHQKWKPRTTCLVRTVRVPECRGVPERAAAAPGNPRADAP